MQRKNKPAGFFFAWVVWIRAKNVTILLCAATLLENCTATRYLKENQSFYTGAEIKMEGDKKEKGITRLKSDLKSFITPTPNGTVLGARPAVWLYYAAGTPKKKKGLRSFIKNKLGSQPVLLSNVDPEKTRRNLEGQLRNKGFFRSTVSEAIVTKHKNSKVVYTVSLMSPFRLQVINYIKMDSIRPGLSTLLLQHSFLKKGQRYNLEKLQTEQARIDEALKNEGFFYFDKRFLLFHADTTIGKHGVDLDLVLESGTPRRATQAFRLKNVRVFPSYILNDSTQIKQDTTNFQGLQLIDDRHNFRPDILSEVINLRPGNQYARRDQEYTISHLMSLKAFKYVSIKFQREKKDSSLLNANIYITPLLQRSIRVQAQAVSKSNNFVGPGLQLTFTDHNLFHGAEMFQFKLHSAYEVQISKQTSGALNALELGAEASVTVPRFIVPVHINYKNARYLPQTQFKLGYTLQQRLQYFRLNSFNAGYGYTWRETTYKTHEFYPADINFVKLDRTSDAFNAILANDPTLANAFQNQFILSTHYTFTINTQLKESLTQKYSTEKPRKSNFYFSGTADVSGNALHAIQRLTSEHDSTYRIFKSPYSQYVRGDVDLRYSLQLDKHSKIATRLIAGIGYAFGNSTNMPYIKQFSIGGSNSIRAFPARSLGPGSYNVRTDPKITTRTYFIDQRGDMKLEGNFEYRFDVVKALKGAVFVDAGNIWLIHQDSTRPGSQFNKDTFLKQIAVGTGFGLRYDFNFFVLRLDVAFPIRKPYITDGNPWVINKIDLGNNTWRSENIIYNIAIGYPF